MPSSSEDATLARFQLEIRDVIDRERELKKPSTLSSNAHADDNNNAPDEPEQKSSTLARIQEEIQNVMERERELKELHLDEGPPQQPEVRATSGPQQATTKPHFRRLLAQSANPHKGVMHRFLKSRGKLQAVAAITNGSSTTARCSSTSQPSAQVVNGTGYELAPPKVPQGQSLRRNFVPTEQKIQQDIAATYRREAELKSLRQSQGSLATLTTADLDAPLAPSGRLRASRSMAQLYASDERLHDSPSPSAMATTSAPPSLKPAKSLAELCNAKDEEVISPQALITHFQEMIKKNQESQRA